MVIQFSAILEPDNFGPWFSRGHANEHNFVAQDILIVEMRGLCDSRSLTKKKDKRYVDILDNTTISYKPHIVTNKKQNQ